MNKMKVKFFFQKQKFSLNEFFAFLDNFNSNLSSSTLHQERNHRSTTFLQTNTNHDSSHRLPIPIGLPDPLTGRENIYLTD